jgi:mRNA degradation ribonuclease J1/J2
VQEVQRGLPEFIFNTASKHDRNVVMFGKKYEEYLEVT